MRNLGSIHARRAHRRLSSVADSKIQNDSKALRERTKDKLSVLIVQPAYFKNRDLMNV